MVLPGTPITTSVPPQSRDSSAFQVTCGWATQSNAHLTPPALNAPRISVSLNGSRATMASMMSSRRPSRKSVAPNWRASASLSGTVSTAMMRRAPLTLSAWITLSPTPPTPNTTAVSPKLTLARLNTAPMPVTTPQPTSAADVSGTSSGIFTHCTSRTRVRSANTDVTAKL